MTRILSRVLSCVFWAAVAVAFVHGSDQAAAVTGSVISGQASVIDGDTIEIHGAKIRLFGIDAPEGRQVCQDSMGRDYRCGQRAALALSDKIGRHTVSCVERDVDRYHRIVAVCSVAGLDVNGWMVRRGWAVAYRHYSEDYVPQEDEASAARAGIWAGSFTPPDEWRHSKVAHVSQARRQSAPTKPASCLIKGNISYNSGQKIYHVPGGKYYDQTRINRPGERWFCTEAEARAAGWRRSME